MADERCLGCMRKTDGQERCPHCGFSMQDYVSDEFMQPGSLLHDRYVVGKKIKTDGEGHTYLGIDQKTGKSVYLREYMPGKLCSRQNGAIVMNIGCDAKFKALQSDFIEVYQGLASLRRLGNIIQVTDLFRANQTVYAVYDFFAAKTLTQYINENAGELDWQTASRLFRPILESLAEIHKSGLIHRGISPETLVMNNDRLMLIDFSIGALRMLESEIETSIYIGYAAPEQYSKMMPHGEWTDVYAVSAVLYKALSGTMPPEAPTRAVNDNLIALSKLNSTVPLAVSNALEMGMVYHPNQRTQSIPALLENLYASKPVQATNATGATTIFDGIPIGGTVPISAGNGETDSEGIDIYSNTAKEDGEQNKMAIWKKTLIIAAPFLLIILFLLFWMINGSSCENKPAAEPSSSEVSSEEAPSSSEEPEVSSEEEEQEESSSEEEDVRPVVPALIGKSYDDVVKSSDYSDFSFSKSEEYSDDYDEGDIIEQSPDAGSKVQKGTEIHLTVSKGPRSILMPTEHELAQYSPQELYRWFSDYGISCVISPTGEYSDISPAGTVARIDGVKPGMLIDRESNVNIIIYPSMGPEPVDQPD